MTISRFLIAALALVATPAAAQQWTVGDQGVNWNVLSTKPTGSAPADAYEPADPVLPVGVTESSWKDGPTDALQVWSVGNPKNTNFLVGADATAKAQLEKKIRITCEPTTVKTKDNILHRGVAKAGHPHQGYGAVNWDENSDYASLRADPKSSCAGGPLNATNYMEPALLKQLPSGLVVAVRAQDQANYYVLGPQTAANEATWIRAGMQFIIGANPSDFNDQARRDAYTAQGFLYPGGPDSPAGVVGWYCVLNNGTPVTVSNVQARKKTDSGGSDGSKARYLKGPGGEDPWGGACTGTEAAPATIASDLIAPGCWDRHNLTSPNGRGHFWYAGRKGDNSITNACPTTTAGVSYGFVPELEVKNIYYTTGFADYGNWYFQSDRMNPVGTAGDPTSLSPCRQVSAWFCNGETLHADYTYGWKRSVFDQMQRECLGVPVRGIAPTDGPAECNASQIDRYYNLKYAGASPDSTWTECATILACYDSTPAKPTERYEVPTGVVQDGVTIEHRH